MSNHYHLLVRTPEGNSGELKNFYEQNRLLPVLGSEQFKQGFKLEPENADIPALKQVREVPSLKQIVQAVCQHPKVKDDAIWTSARGRAVISPARGITMHLCQKVGNMTLAEIADHFGLKSYTCAGSEIRQFERCLARDRTLQKMINLIKPDLTHCCPTNSGSDSDEPFVWRLYKPRPV
jgi:hypothetical protein